MAVAVAGTEEENLRGLAEELAAFTGASVPLNLVTWGQAIDILLELGKDRVIPVVLDEFPYLCKVSPSLPSVVQKAFGARRSQRRESQTRLLLCGSALSFMGGLLSGTAPLQGRAGLDMTVHTFDFRLAAELRG